MFSPKRIVVRYAFLDIQVLREALAHIGDHKVEDVAYVGKSNDGWPIFELVDGYTKLELDAEHIGGFAVKIEAFHDHYMAL